MLQGPPAQVRRLNCWHPDQQQSNAGLQRQEEIQWSWYVLTQMRPPEVGEGREGWRWRRQARESTGPRFCHRIQCPFPNQGVLHRPPWLCAHSIANPKRPNGAAGVLHRVKGTFSSFPLAQGGSSGCPSPIGYSRAILALLFLHSLPGFGIGLPICFFHSSRDMQGEKLAEIQPTSILQASFQLIDVTIRELEKRANVEKTAKN